MPSLICKEPRVNARQAVSSGEMIGKDTSIVSTTLHASVPGSVQRPMRMTLASGRHMDTLPIKTEGDIPSGQDLWEEIFGSRWPTTGLDAFDPEQISRDINTGGLVGLGGAAFPTHVKIKHVPEVVVGGKLMKLADQLAVWII